MKKIVSVIGDANIERDSKKFKLAFETGKLLVDNGYRVQSGGLRGVMNAAFEGAHSSKKYIDGSTIGILPTFERDVSNKYADITIGTGIDLMRNVIVVNTDAVIVVGGGSGTLSEIAHAWAMKKFILAYNNVDGWGANLAGKKIDSRVRFENLDDKVWGFDNPKKLIEFLNKNIDKYSKQYERISPVTG